MDPEVEYMMNTFGLSEENARLAIERGFKVGALMNGEAMDWVKKESGIEKGLSDAAIKVAAMKQSIEQMEQ